MPAWRQSAMPAGLEAAVLQFPESCWFDGVADVLRECRMLRSLSAHVSFQVPPTPGAAPKLPLHTTLSTLSLECTVRSGWPEQLERLLAVSSRLRSLSLNLRFTSAGAAYVSWDLPALPHLEDFHVEFAGPVWGLGADPPGCRACQALALAVVRKSKALRQGCVICHEMGPAFILQMVQQNSRVTSVEEIHRSELRFGCQAQGVLPPRGCSSLEMFVLRSPLEDTVGRDALVKLVEISPWLESVQLHFSGAVVSLPRRTIQDGLFYRMMPLSENQPSTTLQD